MEFRHLSREEQPELYPLLGKCFACWKPFVESRAPFPFEAESFVAKENGVFAAHCGVVKFRISDGAGKTVPLGGLASVCTDPGYRHRGLAETLCRMAIDYGKEEHVAAMPLFTSFTRVYEKNNWRDYPIFMPLRAVWKNTGNPAQLVSGKELAGKEKQKIVALYQNGFDFPGKVVRPAPGSTSVFGWDHTFSHFSFRAGKNVYASGGGNLICELNGDADAPETETFLLSLPRENGATIFALPETSPFWEKIGALASLEKADIFFHGPMVLDLDDRRFFRRFENVYFPLCDRF